MERQYCIRLWGVQSRVRRPIHSKTHSPPFHRRLVYYSQPLSDQIVLVTFSDELASTFIYGGAGRIWRTDTEDRQLIATSFMPFLPLHI
jgi:hypothetical protein